MGHDHRQAQCDEVYLLLAEIEELTAEIHRLTLDPAPHLGDLAREATEIATASELRVARAAGRSGVGVAHELEGSLHRLGELHSRVTRRQHHLVS